MQQARWELAVRAVAASLAFTLLAGCQAQRLQLREAPTLGAQRQTRKQQVVSDYERNRDRAQYEAALSCWERGNQAGCQQALDSLFARSPRHRDGLYLQAELHFAQDRTHDARQVLAALAEEHPQDADIQHALGLVLERLGQPQAAQDCFAQATKLSPQNEVFQISYRTMQERSAKLPANAEEPAGPPIVVSDASNAGSKSFDVADDRMARAEQALARGASEAAAEHLHAAIAESPRNPQLPVSAAVLALRMNQPRLAADLLQSASSAHPHSAAVHRAQGAALYRLGDFAAAETALRKSLSLDNASALSYFLLGCTLQRLGDESAAQANYRQAAAIDPRYAAMP